MGLYGETCLFGAIWAGGVALGLWVVLTFGALVAALFVLTLAAAGATLLVWLASRGGA